MPHRYRPDESVAPPNKFGIANLADLQRVETPLALRRLLELQRYPIRGHFNTGHLRAIHQYIFRDVYEWAGELRSVNISKPGAIFPRPIICSRISTSSLPTHTRRTAQESARICVGSSRGIFPRGNQRDSSVPRRKRPSAARVYPRTGFRRRPPARMERPLTAGNS